MNAMGYVGAIISIVAGCLGLIWPKQVSQKIGLQIPGRLGKSEVRATYGGLFIGAGVAVILIASSDAALVLGAAWAGLLLREQCHSSLIHRVQRRTSLAS